MTNNLTETVNTYHNQFSLAATDEERERLSAIYKTFFEQLTNDEQIIARDASRPYLQEAVKMAKGMDPILERAKQMLRQHEQPTA